METRFDYFYVETASMETARNGSLYLKLHANSGSDRRTIYVWEYPKEGKTYAAFFIKTPVLAADAKGYYALKYNDVQEINQTLLPGGNPLRTLRLKGEYDAKRLTKCMVALADDLCLENPWASLLKEKLPPVLVDYEKFPAGKEAHHPWENGLSTHVVEALLAYRQMARIPYFAQLRHHIAIIALLLHDYGKMLEYRKDVTGAWEKTRAMPMLGHIYISTHFAQTFLQEQLADYGEDKEVQADINHILHCILAHHGVLEYGSPVVPASKEAYLVHVADEMSAKNYQFDATYDMERSYFLGTSVLKNFAL